MNLRWNEWNLGHVARHGGEPGEAESVVRQARAPYPLRYPEDKYFVWGRGQGGRLLQVVYILDPDDTIYVIHARPLTDKEKRRYRRRRKR
jgi:uncharacterized DUF497 family protein